MANNTRKCRYKNCKHKSSYIDITQEEYIADGRSFYHKDCFEEKNKKWNDFQAIKDLWLKNISNTVVYSQLFRILNDLIEKGVDSDYLVFVVDYVVKHKMNLNYPAGLKYFVDKKEIKDAYAKKKLSNSGYSKNCFVVTEQENSAPKFSVNRKTTGFQSIIQTK